MLPLVCRLRSPRGFRRLLATGGTGINKYEKFSFTFFSLLCKWLTGRSAGGTVVLQKEQLR